MKRPEMVSIERTAKERKYEEPTLADKKPLYGYGTRLNLQEEELDKIGCTAKDMPEVGDEFHIFAVGEVIGVHNDAFDSGGGKKESRSVEIQLTHLGVVCEDAEEDKRKPGEILYGRRENENTE